MARMDETASPDVLFPAEALAIMRKARWRPWARRRYDGLSPGFYWSDEFPWRVSDAWTQQCHAVIAFRASLILGEPRAPMRPVWDQLEQECPRWPGFRLARRSPALRHRLEAENARFVAELKVLPD